MSDKTDRLEETVKELRSFVRKQRDRIDWLMESVGCETGQKPVQLVTKEMLKRTKKGLWDLIWERTSGRTTGLSQDGVIREIEGHARQKKMDECKEYLERSKIELVVCEMLEKSKPAKKKPVKKKRRKTAK